MLEKTRIQLQSLNQIISPCDIDISDQVRMPQNNIFLRADGLAGGLTPLSKKE